MNGQPQDTPPLAALSPDERTRALERYRMLQPCVEHDVPLTHVARQHGIAAADRCNGGSPSTDAMASPGWPVAGAVTGDSRTAYHPNSHRSLKGSPCANRHPPWPLSTDKCVRWRCATDGPFPTINGCIGSSSTWTPPWSRWPTRAAKPTGPPTISSTDAKPTSPTTSGRPIIPCWISGCAQDEWPTGSSLAHRHYG